MNKVIKYHRSAIEFDKYYIMKEFSVADFDYVEEVDMKGNNKKNGIKQKKHK